MWCCVCGVFWGAHDAELEERRASDDVLEKGEISGFEVARRVWEPGPPLSAWCVACGSACVGAIGGLRVSGKLDNRF